MVPASDAIDLVVLGAVWGASFLFMRMAAPEFGPVGLIFLRVAIAAVLLGGVLARRGGLRALRDTAGALTVIGALNTAVPFTLFAYASLSLPAGLNAVLNATVPLFGALVALLWLGQRLPGLRLVGLAVGFGGVLALAWPTLSSGDNAGAIAAALAATVLYAVSAHYARQRVAHLPALAVAGGSQIAAALLLAPLAVARWPVVPPTRTAWAAAAGLGVVCTAFAYGLYFRLLARSGAMTAMAVTYLIPVFGVAWGALFLGERLPSSALAGGLLVLAGVALATWAPRARAAAR
jgi:drug/metabolite transporter (DMT)-like permease